MGPALRFAAEDLEEMREGMGDSPSVPAADACANALLRSRSLREEVLCGVNDGREFRCSACIRANSPELSSEVVRGLMGGSGALCLSGGVVVVGGSSVAVICRPTIGGVGGS